MEYQVSLVSLDKIPLDSKGPINPLCNSCVRSDCTNPIREKTVSVLGKVVKMRLWTINNTSKMVIACPEGYIGANDVEMVDDE